MEGSLAPPRASARRRWRLMEIACWAACDWRDVSEEAKRRGVVQMDRLGAWVGKREAQELYEHFRSPAIDEWEKDPRQPRWRIK